jgi:DNA relaxase NicK
MTPEQLASALDKENVYEVELDAKMHQVEVELLQSTEEYFHVMVAVDDGSLPASIVPEVQTFICKKKARNV